MNFDPAPFRVKIKKHAQQTPGVNFRLLIVVNAMALLYFLRRKRIFGVALFLDAESFAVNNCGALAESIFTTDYAPPGIHATDQ